MKYILEITYGILKYIENLPHNFWTKLSLKVEVAEWWSFRADWVFDFYLYLRMWKRMEMDDLKPSKGSGQ
jgi:hypothetical protein